MQLSTRAAKRALGYRLRYRGDAPSIFEDVAQDISLAFYESSQFDRPQSETDFEIWAYRKAKEAFSVHRYHRRNEDQETFPHSDRRAYSDGREKSKFDVLSHSGSVYHTERPFQHIRMDFLDAVKKIGLLGAEDQRLVWAIIDGGDVVGYAKDHGVSLFDAMKELARCRLIMQRLAEDLADEKKFGDS